MIISSTKKKTVGTLLKYEGLLASIIQCGFWGEYRPDIVKELGADVCAYVVSIGKGAIRTLVTDAASSNSAKDKNLLDIIGTTPIVSKDYDPNCMISFVVGLIRDQKNRITLDSNVISVLQPLMEEVDGIDKDVIMEMIDLGMNHVHDYDSAMVVARLSGFMLWKETDNKSCDTRTAFATFCGLIDMCLNFIDSFGAHMSCEEGSDSRCQCTKCLKSSLYNHIASMFKNIYDVVLHQKTAKAIRSKRGSIEEKLVSLEAATEDGASSFESAARERLATEAAKETYLKKKRLDLIEGVKVNEEGFTVNFIEALNDEDLISLFNDEEKAGYEALSTPERISNNPKCKELLDMVRSILNLNGSFCCRCNKQLSRTEVLHCNGCGCMTYCSRACQKEDWLNGHKLTCSKMCTNDNIGMFQGRLWPMAKPVNERDAQKMKEVETNFTMVQLKIFLDHSDTILSQAKALGIPLCDCIVVFDLRHCPLTVGTFEYTHKGKFYSSNYCIASGYFESDQEREGFEASRSRENITCSFVSNTFIGDDVLDQDGDVVQGLQMQRLFPHEWLTQKANQISDDDKSKQIVGKQICQKAKTVNNESYTEDDNKKIGQTHWNKERRRLDPAYEYNIPKLKVNKKV